MNVEGVLYSRHFSLRRISCVFHASTNFSEGESYVNYAKTVTRNHLPCMLHGSSVAWANRLHPQGMLLDQLGYCRTATATSGGGEHRPQSEEVMPITFYGPCAWCGVIMTSCDLREFIDNREFHSPECVNDYLNKHRKDAEHEARIQVAVRADQHSSD